MLEELKNINYQGGKDGLLFFLQDVIGKNNISIHDARIICSHSLGVHPVSVESLIDYCCAFGWIKMSNGNLELSTGIVNHLANRDDLNNTLIASTVNRMFDEGIFNSDMFYYDAVNSYYGFRNELLSLSFSSVRNVLISQGFIVAQRSVSGSRFHIAVEYEPILSIRCRNHLKAYTLEILKRELEDREIAGEKAELFVLMYEKERIGMPLCNKIKRISEIDVSAGYDIVSYNSACSIELDRFIEVKALSRRGFYWSRNEYEVAKLKGDSYFLYLIELNKTSDINYQPQIIRNPAERIFESDEWFIEPQSYHIIHT